MNVRKEREATERRKKENSLIEKSLSDINSTHKAQNQETQLNLRGNHYLLVQKFKKKREREKKARSL